MEFSMQKCCRCIFIVFLLLVVSQNSHGSLKSSSARSMLQDKGFDNGWIDSLTDRGKPDIYTGDQLEYIGMPVGGLFCGQVYLGGDGQLWYWEVNNLRSIDPGEPGDKYYLIPMTRDGHQRVEQGFAVSVKSNGKTQTRQLNREGFRDIKFHGQYPIGTVVIVMQTRPLMLN